PGVAEKLDVVDGGREDVVSWEAGIWVDVQAEVLAQGILHAPAIDPAGLPNAAQLRVAQDLVVIKAVDVCAGEGRIADVALVGILLGVEDAAAEGEVLKRGDGEVGEEVPLVALGKGVWPRDAVIVWLGAADEVVIARAEARLARGAAFDG